MSTPNILNQHYAAIGAQEFNEERLEAYAEFYRYATSERPNLFEIEDACLQGGRAQLAIALARDTETYELNLKDQSQDGRNHGERIAKNVGIIIVGDSKSLLAAHYQHQEYDVRLDLDPNYHHEALLNAGRGLLCLAQGVEPHKQQKFISVIEARCGLASEATSFAAPSFYGKPIGNMYLPFHSGHSARNRGFVAGAAGTQASDHFLSHLPDSVRSRMSTPEPGKTTADTYIGRVLCEQTVDHMISGKTEPSSTPARIHAMRVSALLDEDSNGN